MGQSKARALHGMHWAAGSFRAGDVVQLGSLTCPQVRRYSKEAVEADFSRRMAVAGVLETTGMLLPPRAAAAALRKKKPKKRSLHPGLVQKEKEPPVFEVGRDCSVDPFKSGDYYPAEITKDHRDGTFTVKMLDGGLKGVSITTSLVCAHPGALTHCDIGIHGW